MLKLIGSVLLMGGASAMGFSAAAHLRTRVRCLRSFAAAVEYMERELSFRLTPTPALLRDLTDTAFAPANRFFAHCSGKLSELGEKPLNILWRQALEKSGLPLEQDEMRTLFELGEIIGRYDGDGQCEALSLARDRLEGFVKCALEEQYRLEKVYRALGLSSGAFLLLVLL